MADEHRVSRKEQERRKGWIGIAVWIGAVALLLTIITIAKSIGTPDGRMYYIYFEDSVAGLLKNSKVKYRGVEAGRVVDITLTSQPRVVLPDGTVGPDETLRLSPMVQVQIVVTNDQANINQNSRAFLKTNPLSGMQQIDLNDAAAGRGAELLKAPDGGYECDLYAGGVDLGSWVDVTIESKKAGVVSVLEFSEGGGGEAMAHAHLTVPYRYRSLGLETMVAWADASVEKGRGYINIVPHSLLPPGAPGYPITRGESPREFVVELPAAALAIDPVLRGEFSATPGGPASSAARLTRLEQMETIGTTGAMVKYLHLVVTGDIEPRELRHEDENDPQSPLVDYSRWLALKRSLTAGDRYLDVEIMFKGAGLPVGAPIEVARSPLAVLMDRAEVLAEFVDYLPAIARNIEEAAANVVNITSDLRTGALADLRGAITDNSALLGDAIASLKDDLRDSLLAKIQSLSDTLNAEVKRLGDTTVGKVEEAFDAETMANLKKIAADVATSTQDWKEGIAAAKATFQQAKDIVGLKSADGKTLAETIDGLAAAMEKVDGILAQNSNQISDVMGGLDETLKQLRATLKTLDDLARNLKGRKDN